MFESVASAFWFGTFGAVIVIFSAALIVLHRPATRFLRVQYGRTYGEGFARLISVWTTLAFAIGLFVFGGTILVLAINGLGFA